MQFRSLYNWPKQKLSNLLIRYLTSPSHHYHAYSISSANTLDSVIQRGDVLLVEGNQRFSSAVKYLTQSTWSHAALYVGDLAPANAENGEPLTLIEADLQNGVHAVPLSKYESLNTRICRPRNLTEADSASVAQFMVASLGLKYDMKNVFDLARYLLPTPPVPIYLRRRLLAFGSGDPTRVICSTLIAQAFQSVRYPILPDITKNPDYDRRKSNHAMKEIMHIRHYTLFAPRDFDISPYFSVIKPTIELGFDYKRLEWGGDAQSTAPSQ